MTPGQMATYQLIVACLFIVVTVALSLLSLNLPPQALIPLLTSFLAIDSLIAKSYFDGQSK